jgi:hypothetical protein
MGRLYHTTEALRGVGIAREREAASISLPVYARAERVAFTEYP